MADELADIRKRIEAAALDEPEPEPESVQLESGSLTLTWKKAIVERDEHGLILGVREDGSYKQVQRDEHGRIVAIVEENEEETQE
jgi:hypothetical protein